MTTYGHATSWVKAWNPLYQNCRANFERVSVHGNPNLCGMIPETFRWAKVTTL